MRSRCAGTISLQQPAMDPVFDTRATADVLIARCEGRSATAAKYPRADYRELADRPLPGRRSGVHARAPDRELCTGTLARARADARPFRRRARPRTPIERHGRLLSASSIRIPVLGDGAARTSRGCRSCRIRSRRSAGRRWSRCIRATAAKLGIDERRSRHGRRRRRHAHRSGVSVSQAFGSDTVAIAIGRGHTALRPLRQGSASNRARCCCRVDGRSRGRRGTRRTKANVAKAAAARRSSRPKAPRDSTAAASRSAITVDASSVGRRAKHGGERSEEHMPGDAIARVPAWTSLAGRERRAG